MDTERLHACLHVLHENGALHLWALDCISASGALSGAEPVFNKTLLTEWSVLPVLYGNVHSCVS